MRWVALFSLTLLITVVPTQSVDAQIYENITNVPVPLDLSLEIQNEFQAYIMYKVEETSNGYSVLMARDDEPHQYPVFTTYFNKNWQMIGKTEKIMPKKPETPKPPEQTKPPKPTPTFEPPDTLEEIPPADPIPEIQPSPTTPAPIPVTPTPDKPIDPRDEPVVKPPEEDPEPEEPEDTVE